jgi:hypothetical protein
MFRALSEEGIPRCCKLRDYGLCTEFSGFPCELMNDSSGRVVKSLVASTLPGFCTRGNGELAIESHALRLQGSDTHLEIRALSEEGIPRCCKLRDYYGL